MGETLVSLGDYETDYSYTGEMSDKSGLINLRARYYDPGIGRFVSRDTWAGNYKNPITLAKWLYANANPNTYIDPSGHFSGNVLDKFWSTTTTGCDGNDYKGSFIPHEIPIRNPTIAYHLSLKGEWFIKRYELHRHWPYDDKANNCTIGWGSRLNFPKIEDCKNDYYEREDAIFKVQNNFPREWANLDPIKGLSNEDIEKFFHDEVLEIEKKIGVSIHIWLTQYEFDALVSYLYNSGEHKLANSRQMLDNSESTYAKLINDGDIYMAWNTILYRSSYDSKEIFHPILYERRYEEMEMYFYGDYIVDPGNNISFQDYFPNEH